MLLRFCLDYAVIGIVKVMPGPGACLFLALAGPEPFFCSQVSVSHARVLGWRARLLGDQLKALSMLLRQRVSAGTGYNTCLAPSPSR